MNLFIAFIKLIRLPNLLIIVLTQYAIRFGIIYPIVYSVSGNLGFELQMTELDFFLLCLSTAMIAAAGYIINDYCKKNKKILISAAISKFEGHLFKFNFKKKSNCFRCFMPDIPDEIQNCDIDGVIPTLAGTMGTIQASEVVKSIIRLLRLEIPTSIICGR